MESQIAHYLPSFLKVDYVLALLFFMLSLLSLKIRHPIEKVLLKIFLRDERITKEERLFMNLSKWICYSLAILFLNLGIVQLPIPKKTIPIVNGFFFILYAIIVYFVSAKIVDIILEKFSKSVKKKIPPSEVSLVDTYYSMISKLMKVFIFFVALIAVFEKFGFNVTSLITSLGVGSLAVGLAAQDTIKNFISGIFLVTDRQFRIGDRVYIRDIDVEGYVYDIGLRNTKLLTVSGNNLVTVPNSKLTEGVIENALYPNPKFKDVVEIGVAYGSDVGKVKELLLKAANGVEGLLKDPAPSVYFLQFGDSALVFKLFYFVERKDVAFKVKSELHQKIDRLFKENGIEIPFPQNDLWFRNPIKVEVKNGETLQRKDEELQGE